MEDKQTIAKAKSSDLFSVVLSDDWSIKFTFIADPTPYSCRNICCDLLTSEGLQEA
jgi:hypothetical protein